MAWLLPHIIMADKQMVRKSSYSGVHPLPQQTELLLCGAVGNDPLQKNPLVLARTRQRRIFACNVVCTVYYCYGQGVTCNKSTPPRDVSAFLIHLNTLPTCLKDVNILRE